jgi:hypothetical protein
MQTGVKVDVDLRWARLAVTAFYLPVALRLLSPDRAGALAARLVRYTTTTY